MPTHTDTHRQTRTDRHTDIHQLRHRLIVGKKNMCPFCKEKVDLRTIPSNPLVLHVHVCVSVCTYVCVRVCV